MELSMEDDELDQDSLNLLKALEMMERRGEGAQIPGHQLFQVLQKVFNFDKAKYQEQIKICLKNDWIKYGYFGMEVKGDHFYVITDKGKLLL